MVDIGAKIDEIVMMIDRGQYFTINRARQYGKTTTLSLLAKALPEEYTCISLSFEGVGETMFKDPKSFCQRFLLHINKTLARKDKRFADEWLDKSVTDFDLLGFHLDNLCKDSKIVLIIDEVDKTSNNSVFLHFLGMLRSKYLVRDEDAAYTFHSVILAGVYDIRNIKLKLIDEGIFQQHSDVGRLYNSPWNIAADFDVDMSFCPAEIAGMLSDYEADYKTGMDTGVIAATIHDHTNGYPFLVSRICQHIDEKLDKDWSPDGVLRAVKLLLNEHNVLFDDMFKNLENNEKLYDFLYEILIIGEEKAFNMNDPLVQQASMYGYINKKNDNGKVVISNSIFETSISDYFISKDSNAQPGGKRVNGILQRDIIVNNEFDMELCIRKFAEHYSEIYSEADIPFLERHGRLLFLSYLKPLINGQGFYHIESQFTDVRRMDIVVDFGCNQFIIELKLWKGEVALDAAHQQLLGYMESKNADAGYLVVFDFRKDTNKARNMSWLNFGDKRIFEVIL